MHTDKGCISRVGEERSERSVLRLLLRCSRVGRRLRRLGCDPQLLDCHAVFRRRGEEAGSPEEDDLFSDKSKSECSDADTKCLPPRQSHGCSSKRPLAPDRHCGRLCMQTPGADPRENGRLQRSHTTATSVEGQTCVASLSSGTVSSNIISIVPYNVLTRCTYAVQMAESLGRVVAGCLRGRRPCNPPSSTAICYSCCSLH